MVAKVLLVLRAYAKNGNSEKNGHPLDTWSAANL